MLPSDAQLSGGQMGGDHLKNLAGNGSKDDDAGSGDDEADGGKKGKRRSKNDVEGRDWNCSICTKTYLSYPALYTHMKTKHTVGPDGEARAPPTSGRGRGRPRKHVSLFRIGLFQNILVSFLLLRFADFCCFVLFDSRITERILLKMRIFCKKIKREALQTV